MAQKDTYVVTGRAVRALTEASGLCKCPPHGNRRCRQSAGPGPAGRPRRPAVGREAGCGAATPQPNSGLRSSPRYFSAFSHTSPSGNLGNDVWMGSHEPRRSESTLRGKRLWPVAVRGPCRGDVALGAVLGWTGEAAAPGPPLSSRDRFHTHSGPRCPVAGIPWGLSLQLAYRSDHTGEEQGEPAITKLQVGLHAAHQGSLNPAPRTGCEATPPSFLGSPQ